MNNTGEMLKARLRELRHKMKSATTAKEKEIYSEGVRTCIADIRSTHKKTRTHTKRNIFAGICFIVLISLVLFLVSMLRDESIDSQPIGGAFSETSN